MKKYILKKNIFALVFMVILFGFSAVNMLHTYEPLKELILTREEITIAALDNEITTGMYGKMNFIEIYSFIQKILDKREINNFDMIQDEQGFLHYASFFREPDDNVFEYAMRVKRLRDYVSANGTEVLFVVAPGKYSSNHTIFREGMPVNNPENLINELLFELNRLGIATLNLCESIPNSQVSYEEAFFKTDHHWTIPAAFYATQELVNTMKKEFGLDLDPDGYYTDINSYQVETYFGGMFGSMGRRTGAVFSGVDDFTALWPKFEGDFERETITDSDDIMKISGSFQKAFMNTNALMGQYDLYSDSQYALYLNVVRVYEKIVNNEKPDGTKIFMIRDSYFSPVIAFLMPMCGEIDAIWSLEESNEIDIEDYVKNNEFDYIIIEVYPYNIDDAAFNYFREKE